MNPEGKKPERKPEPKAVEKVQELNLDALDRVSAGTNSDHTRSIMDAIKKTLDQKAQMGKEKL